MISSSLPDPSMFSCPLRTGRVSLAPTPVTKLDNLPFRIFQLMMAFDALRLRNVIQLFGILSESLKFISQGGVIFIQFGSLVFHLGMMVFAAVQVEQTRIALVIGEDCDTDWTSTVRPVSVSHLCPAAQLAFSYVKLFRDLLASEVIMAVCYDGIGGIRLLDGVCFCRFDGRDFLTKSEHLGRLLNIEDSCRFTWRTDGGRENRLRSIRLVHRTVAVFRRERVYQRYFDILNHCDFVRLDSSILLDGWHLRLVNWRAQGECHEVGHF